MPRTYAETAELYEIALRQVEQRRDDIIVACRTLRNLCNSERKLAGLPPLDLPETIVAEVDRTEPSRGETP